jgi:hypothetical protein
MTQLDLFNFACPHCGFTDTHKLVETEKDPQRSRTSKVVAKREDGGYDAEETRWSHLILRCAKCGRDTYRLVETELEKRSFRPVSRGEAPPPITIPQEPVFHLIHQFPVGSPAAHISVPEDVQKAMTEVEQCFAVGAYSACGTMARRAADAFALDKKAEGRDLYERLADLKGKGLITPTLYDWAEELRTAGKVGAHPEWEDLNAEEADYAVRLLREIIRFIYINPAEVAERRLKGTKSRKP